VTGFNPANFEFRRLCRSRVTSKHSTDGRTDTAAHHIMPPFLGGGVTDLGRGIIIGVRDFEFSSA